MLQFKDLSISGILSYRNRYVLGLLLIVIGLPLSKFLMSVGQFVLVGNWLTGLDYATKAKRFFSDKWALLFSSLLFLHLIGLLHTTDFDYAFKDIRIKLPLLLLPFLIGSEKKLSAGEFKTLVYAFILAVLAGTFAGVYKMLVLHGESLVDQRNLSVFISHIRFGLMISLAVFFCVYLISTGSKLLRVLLILCILWLFSFLLMTAFFTGIAVLLLTASSLLFVFLFRKNFWLYRLMAFAFVLLLLLFPAKIITDNVSEYFSHHPTEHAELDKYSKGGEKYFHDTTGVEARITENGHYIWRYIAWMELKRGWERRSEYGLDDKDQKGQLIRGTLVRYMTSKGLRKDSIGLSKLTDKDINAIEQGIADAEYVDTSPLDVRVQEIIWEFDNYRKGDEYNGHSLVMRWVYWKTAADIICDNFWWGVGTGDIDMAFQEKYEQNNVRLDEKWRLRAHNQFLTFFATFGIFGLLWFLLVLLLPLFSGGWKNWYYLTFVIIAVLSMLTEDTLETQAGVTFFAFWNTLLFLACGKEARKSAKSGT